MDVCIVTIQGAGLCSCFNMYNSLFLHCLTFVFPHVLESFKLVYSQLQHQGGRPRGDPSIFLFDWL